MTIRILKQATCGKVTTPDKPTLTYNIGSENDHFYVRVIDNVGGGFFSHEWIELSTIIETLPNDTPFNASALAPLFTSKSANNAGFLAAALKAEKLIVPVKETKRLHNIGNVSAFTKTMQKLIKSKISLPDEVAEREAIKEAKRIALAEKLAKSKTNTDKA
jgi:hypothetical protein